MKIIISGGGTGGHIYPAIAVANELKNIDPNAEILFVGAKDKMEMQKVPQAGYPIKGLWISGIQRKISAKNLLFPFKLTSSLWNAYQIIRQFKPDVVVGFGGFASGAVLYVANWFKIPTLIQEQNSYAGLTNKWLAKKASKICVAYPNMEKFFPASKILLTGNPVRKDITNIATKKAEALTFFNLKDTQKTLFVMGGSLGARSINQSIAQALPQMKDANIQLIWQTGKSYWLDNQAFIQQNIGINIKIFEFIQRMDLAYSIADVVVSRAGALSIAELCLAGKPTIFVPFPLAAEDHQTENVKALLTQNAAILVTDQQAYEKLVPTALALLQNETQQKALAQNIKALAKPNAALEIAQEIRQLVKK